MSGITTAARRRVRRRTLKITAPSALHVLLADRGDVSRAHRIEGLLAAGFRVATARTGFEAIVKASCQLPDLILLGDLPDMDPGEAGQLLTTCPVTAHIPIVRLAPDESLPAQALSALRRASA